MRQDEPPRHTILTWNDVEGLIDRLLPQMTGVFDALALQVQTLAQDADITVA